MSQALMIRLKKQSVKYAEKSKLCIMFLVSTRLLFTVALGIMSLSTITSCVEKYTEQGHNLSRKANEYLISRGVCTDTQDCNAKLEIYGEYGDRIYFNIYNPKDRKSLAVYIEFIVENGMQVTDGVPISISVFPKSKEEYVNTFALFAKPVMKVRVDK